MYSLREHISKQRQTTAVLSVVGLMLFGLSNPAPRLWHKRFALSWPAKAWCHSGINCTDQKPILCLSKQETGESLNQALAPNRPWHCLGGKGALVWCQEESTMLSQLDLVKEGRSLWEHVVELDHFTFFLLLSVFLFLYFLGFFLSFFILKKPQLFFSVELLILIFFLRSLAPHLRRRATTR